MSAPDTAVTRTPTATHWGNYDVLTRDGRVVELVPSSGDPDPSPIGSGMAGTLRDELRIEQPMVRRGWLEDGPGNRSGGRGREPFVAVSPDEAVELVAAELERVRSTYGNQAIFAGSYGWASAGRFHQAAAQLHRFLNEFGGFTDSIGTHSMGALEAVLPHVIGGFGMSVLGRGTTFDEIISDGRLVVAFGGMAAKNSQVSLGGIGRHVTPARLREARQAGVEFVNFSPVRSDVDADLYAEWAALRPGTDVAVMLGLAYEIVAADLHDKEFLDRCCVGFEPFARYLRGESDGVVKDAAWAESVSDVPQALIVDLARRIATQRTVISASWSTQRCAHGEQTHWMAIVLAAISGSLGKPGGGYAPGLGIISVGVRRAFRHLASLPQGENAVTETIPVARLGDMLRHPGEAYDYNGEVRHYPAIELIYWAGGNPFHHHQDLNRLVNDWQRPSTVIVHEPWWNPNARFADIVLPVATTLERNDFAAGIMDLTITAMHRAVEPPAGARTDYEWFSALSERLGFGESFTHGRTADEWVLELYERTRDGLMAVGVEIPDFDQFWSDGSVELPEAEESPGGQFWALRDDPEENAFATPSGRIEIYSETIASFGYDDCPGHPTWLEPAEWLGAPLAQRFPLHLIGSQPAQRLHSQYDNGSASRDAKVGGREPVWIHPLDAGARGIADGDAVRLYNDRGQCFAGARVTDDARPGVVRLATGAWFDPEDPGAPGSRERHGNPNVLTADRPSSRLAQATSAGSTLVEIELAVDPPTPAPFRPPQILRRG